MHATPMIDRVIRHISKLTPNIFAANAALLGLHYVARHHALPCAVTSEKAGLMDYLFWRSIGRWSGFERECVDKELSKRVARRLCGGVGIVATLDLFALEGMSYARFRGRIESFSGERAVVKPTHGSGAVLFLDQPFDERTLRKFYHQCRDSYFALFREGQYYQLEKKVLIERRLGAPGGRAVPDDYKFFCSRGRAFLCQINLDRYGDHRLVNMTVPDFTDSGVEYGTRRPDDPVERPARWRDFIAYAEALSAPFEFVRVDLFDGGDDIYFSEFTFTPAAGLLNFSDRQFDKWLLSQIRFEPREKSCPSAQPS